MASVRVVFWPCLRLIQSRNRRRSGEPSFRRSSFEFSGKKEQSKWVFSFLGCVYSLILWLVVDCKLQPVWIFVKGIRVCERSSSRYIRIQFVRKTQEQLRTLKDGFRNISCKTNEETKIS